MRFTTDKVNIGLLPTYLRIAAEIGPAGHVCEVGVRGGDSLEMWQALFPHGVIVGVDNNTDGLATWPEGTHQVVMDQSATKLPKELHYFTNSYDLIVDDASHEGVKTRATFNLLWPMIRPGGYYAVEDWTVGFPEVTTHDGSMFDLARDLLHLLGPNGDVESIEYRRGLALLKKVKI